MCAFAAPDMTVENVRGIPDTFEGRTLLAKHRLNIATSTTAGVDTYYVLAPVPGIAYLQAQVPAGTPVLSTTLFTPVPYPDFANFFPASNQVASVMQSFRFVSNAFEIVPTVNQMTWVGSISAWKAPIRMVQTGVITANSAGAGLSRTYEINGLEACNATGADLYYAPFNDGVYTLATQQEPDFEFAPLIDSLFPDNNPAAFGQISGYLTGFGSLESVIIKVAGQTASMPLVLRAWSCVEYMPAPNTAFYRFSQTSPSEDHAALALYRKIAKALPVAVPYYKNDTFWERVKGIIGDLTTYMARVPGPIGETARAASLAYNVANRLIG